jgi:hypothetical protein
VAKKWRIIRLSKIPHLKVFMQGFSEGDSIFLKARSMPVIIFNSFLFNQFPSNAQSLTNTKSLSPHRPPALTLPHSLFLSVRFKLIHFSLPRKNSIFSPSFFFLLKFIYRAIFTGALNSTNFFSLYLAGPN